VPQKSTPREALVVAMLDRLRAATAEVVESGDPLVDDVGEKVMNERRSVHALNVAFALSQKGVRP
jgi:hypothetical protein